MYDTTHSRPEVFAFYDRELAARGFQARPVGPKADPHGLKQEFRAFTKDGNAVLIATDTLKGNKTGVTLIEMGSFGAAQAFAIRR